MGRKFKHAPQARADRPADSPAANTSFGSDAGKAIPGHSEVRVDPVSGDKRRRRPQWMTRLRNNPANVVEQDTSDSDGSFSHSKQIDDDTRDDDDDEIEIMTPRNVSSEIPRSSVFRRVSTEVVPAPSSPDDYQRKVSGDKPRKVTFDSSPTSTKKTVVAAKSILKKPEPEPYAVMLPLTPTRVLNQEQPVASISTTAETHPSQSSRGSSRPHRLHLPRRPSRSSTLDSVMGNAPVAEATRADKPLQVTVDSSSSESSPEAPTSSLAKEIARELVKEVKLLQPAPLLPSRPRGSPPVLSLDTPAESSPSQSHAHRTGRLSVRRRQQAWRQRRVVRKAIRTDAYVDKIVHEINGQESKPEGPTSEPVSESTSSPRVDGKAPSFYWDPSGAFEFYTSAQWWEHLRDRANSANDGSRSFRKQLFLNVDGAAMWLHATVTGCVSRVRSRCESVMALVSRIQARFGWYSDGGAVPA